MKTLIKLLILSICLISTSQNSNLTPFVGNWEWQNGNQTFKVEIYIDGNDLEGHYQLVETTNGVETIIYNSNKLLNAEHDFYFGNAIFGGSNNGILFHAKIEDNVLLGNGNDNLKTGNLAFTITNNGLNGQPITATWRVKQLQGLKSTDEPENFNIPTDITLTKVE